MLVPARCTQCSATIEVDDAKEAGICQFCNTAFITQKAIHEHHTHITKNITKNVFSIDGKTAEDFCANGDTFLKLKDWEKAQEAFDKAVEAEPTNYKGYWGLVKTWTENFTDYYDVGHKEHIPRALNLSSGDEKAVIETQYNEYQKRCEAIAPLKAKHDRFFKLFGWCGALGVLMIIAIGITAMVIGLLAAEGYPVNWLTLAWMSIPVGVFIIGFSIGLDLCVRADKKIDAYKKEHFGESEEDEKNINIEKTATNTNDKTDNTNNT